MFCSSLTSSRVRRQIPARISLFIAACLLVSFFPSRSGSRAQAQSYEKELTTGKSLLTIKNRNGRVSVVTSDDEKSKAGLRATSSGAAVEPADVSISGSEITVRERRNRNGMEVRVPKRGGGGGETGTGMGERGGESENPAGFSKT